MQQLPCFASLLLLLLWPTTAAVQHAGAAEYLVGDVGYGWDSGINYAAWAREYAFAVGDVLVFEYVNTQHNVYEVTEEAYRSCDTTAGNGVRAKDTTGYDRVLLAEARDYWFICDFPGHCLGGMKVAVVNVSAAQQLQHPPPPDYVSSAGGGGRAASAWALPLGVVVALMIIIM
ncbi:hypothetical protein BS78_10G258700 [Paspalum vaginatum]|nr:hypothetical protein BS78_10G258700 [Paspalum vaginatum]